MADDFQLNVGVGGDLAAGDDIGGVKTQRVKLTLGDDGVNAGDVSANNPMPIDLLSAQGTPLAAGPGVAANALRVELAADGQGKVFARALPVASSPSGRTTVPFTETSTEIVPINNARKSVLLYNDGNFPIHIGVGEPATLNSMLLEVSSYLKFEGVGAVSGFNLIASNEDVDVLWTDEGY